MESIIKKAIEGGWKPKNSAFKNFKTKKQVLEMFEFCYPDEESITQHKHTFEYVCDPLFWQSLGKACGWDTLCKECKSKAHPLCFNHNYHTWKGVALRFHEINLTEGWEKAVKWLEELVANK